MRFKSSYKKIPIRYDQTIGGVNSEWIDEDYQPLPESIDEVLDPWETDSQSAAQISLIQNNIDWPRDQVPRSLDNDIFSNASDEFFDDVGYGNESYHTPRYDSYDEYDDLILPDYDGEAQRSPWGEIADAVTIESGQISHFAKSRAKEVSDMLDCRNDRELEQAYDYFLIFFGENPSSSTLNRVRKLAEAGIDLEAFKQVVELREMWRDSHYISWVLAYTICKNRQDYPLDCMVDENWFLEWKVLRYPQWYASDLSQSWRYGYKLWSSDISWSFARFLEEKFNAPEVAMLNTGLVIKKDHDYFFDEIRNSDMKRLHTELVELGQAE